MEWLKQLIESHTTDGKTDIEAVMNAVKEEFPKHAVPKSVYNEQADKLKQANDTLDSLKKNNKDNEALQAELKSYKEKISAMEREAKEKALQQSVKDALVGAKATDVDYLMFKLGALEETEDGKVKDLDNKIKDLQVNLPQFFATAPEESKPEGYQSLGGAGLLPGSAESAKDVVDVIASKELNLTQFLREKAKG